MKLLDQDDDAFEKTLLRSARDDAPAPGAAEQAWEAFAAASGAAAAAVVALPQVAPSDAVVSEPARVASEKGGGYHLSARVKQYDKTTQL